LDSCCHPPRNWQCRLWQHARKGGETHREIRQIRSNGRDRRGRSQPRCLREQAGTGSGSEQHRNVQITDIWPTV
jgi:hypothetical protein